MSRPSRVLAKLRDPLADAELVAEAAFGAAVVIRLAETPKGTGPPRDLAAFVPPTASDELIVMLLRELADELDT